MIKCNPRMKATYPILHFQVLACHWGCQGGSLRQEPQQTAARRSTAYRTSKGLLSLLRLEPRISCPGSGPRQARSAPQACLQYSLLETSLFSVAVPSSQMIPTNVRLKNKTKQKTNEDNWEAKGRLERNVLCQNPETFLGVWQKGRRRENPS